MQLRSGKITHSKTFNPKRRVYAKYQTSDTIFTRPYLFMSIYIIVVLTCCVNRIHTFEQAKTYWQENNMNEKIYYWRDYTLEMMYNIIYGNYSNFSSLTEGFYQNKYTQCIQQCYYL